MMPRSLWLRPDEPPSAPKPNPDNIELPAHIDTELFLDLIGRHFIFVRDQRIELDAVLVAHLYPVRIPELQSSGDIPDSHQAGIISSFMTFSIYRR